LVKVSSSAGGKVNVEVHGINETKMFLEAKRRIVLTASDAGVLRAANYVEQEVQESIIGKKKEPKSVRTGRFGNSIRVDKVGNARKVLILVVLPQLRMWQEFLSMVHQL